MVKIEKKRVVDLDNSTVRYLLRNLTYGAHAGMWPAICHIRKHNISDAYSYLAKNNADEYVGHLLTYRILGYRNTPRQIMQMFVHCSYRYCGLGERLILAAKKDFKVLTGVKNEDSHNLYTKLGIVHSEKYVWCIPGRNSEHHLMDIMDIYENILDTNSVF